LSITESERLKEWKNDETISSGSRLRLLCFILALLYWGTWFATYGIIWLWAVLHYPGTHQSVLQMARVWVGFHAKMGTVDALSKLTTCLQDAIPDRNATIADIIACLEEMGIKNR
jgi:hypothetical protein